MTHPQIQGQTQVLIVLPDTAGRAHTRSTLEANGLAVSELASPAGSRGIEAIDFAAFSCIVADADAVLEPDCDLLALCRLVPVILLASPGDVRQAVTAMKRGACDYLVRPVREDELIAAVERCVAERNRGREEPALGEAFPMLGKSPPMQELFSRIGKVGPTECTVLIRGESGTGKELVARALHAASRRNHAPMISLNCAAIPPHLIETELFGYSPSDANPDRTRRGLLEAADGGTLFLDEIGELGLESQARLLRVLQAGELRRFGSTEVFPVNVRLIAATHRDLDKLIRSGKFRDDLYYRLNVVTLEIPPLRERGGDIPQLADFILDRAREKLGKPHARFSDDARQAMRTYAWPGNVRELENAIERAMILCEGDTIDAELLAIDDARAPAPDAGVAADQTSLEDYFVSFVLAHQDHLTETELAEKLGISRKSLWERRHRLNIPRRKTRNRGPRRDNV